MKYINVLILTLAISHIAICQNFKNSSFNNAPRNEYLLFGMGIKFAPSLIFYDQKTSEIKSNRNMFTWDLLLFYRNINLILTSSATYTYDNFLIKNIPYVDGELSNTQKLKFELNSINIGYSVMLKSYDFRIQPSIGSTYYWFLDDESNKGIIRVNGYNFSIELSKWFFDLKSVCIFVRNQFYITNLGKLNPEFGNYANIISIGVGGVFGAWI
jgi:hypothetical protein